MALGCIGGYLLTNALLTEFYSVHVEVGPAVVVLCGLSIFLIGISTTSGTILRAANANPVDTLRDE